MNFGIKRLECILFSEQQYNDLIRFCISDRNFSIVNIDTTYNLGKYFVTFLTYKNLSLSKSSNESHPVFIGPIMIHLNQDKQAYLTFAMELKKYDLINQKKLDKIKCFITDDDQAIRSAFKSIFNNSSFMLCCNHLKRNFIKTLNEFKVKEEDQKNLLIEIFGNKKDRQNSVIGSENENEFYSRSDDVIKKLKEFKHPYKKDDLGDWYQNNLISKIYYHFCEIIWSSEDMKKDYYTTNEIEGKLSKK